jgi:hypothetical protein
MTDGIGTSPSREKVQVPPQDEQKSPSAERDKSKSPSRSDGIGTSP